MTIQYTVTFSYCAFSFGLGGSSGSDCFIVTFFCTVDLNRMSLYSCLKLMIAINNLSAI